jgi:hypothetical protein
MNQRLSIAVQQITPPFIWNAYQKARRRRHWSSWREFGLMGTAADPALLYSGRFGELCKKFDKIEPCRAVREGGRYQNYIWCFLAGLCREVPGDFLYAGVSFGLSAKLVYEFTDACAGKTFHLVDPFDAAVSRSDKRTSAKYNNSVDYVRQQYPADAKIMIHQTTIPMDPPQPLAFAVLHTGDPASERVTLPVFYDALSPGGIIVSGGVDRGFNGIEPFWFPTGNHAFFKRR